MPERDYVADVLQLSYSGVFDFDGLYKVLYRWFQQYRYSFKELDYKEFKDGGVKKLQIKWQATRKVTDYVRYVFEVGFLLNNMNEVVVKNKKRMSGSLSISVAAYLEKDYEETWARRTWLKFVREVYDRFVTGSKITEMQQELITEMNAFRNEVKTFLNMQKVGQT